MNVAIFADGDVFNNDRIFDDSPDNYLNFDNALSLWINARHYLEARGHKFHTFDMYPSLKDIDKAIFLGLYHPNYDYHQKLLNLGTDCYYIAYEPPVIHDYNEQNRLRSLRPFFKKILTEQEDLFSCEGFYPLYEGKVRPDKSRLARRLFNERWFMILLNSYRYSNNDTYRELYTERFKAARFFEQVEDTFHIYGRGLNDPSRIEKRWPYKKPEFFHSYVDEVDNKLEAMGRYRYSLCFENCDGIYGYITEKIIHCFAAGVIPIYWGAMNPLDYFDEGTFIDMRAFTDYPELYRYLNSIDESRFNEYLEAIDNYLESDRYRHFFGDDVFPRQIHDMLFDETPSQEPPKHSTGKDA